MNTTYTYSQIANSYALWTEYADADGIISREQFDTMSEGALVAMLTDMFGAEPTEARETPDFEAAARTADGYVALVQAITGNTGNADVWVTMTHEARVEALRGMYYWNVIAA